MKCLTGLWTAISKNIDDSRRQRDDAFLAESADAADLERRIKQLAIRRSLIWAQ